MNRLTIIFAAALLFSACICAQGAECGIVNGSFEEDGVINKIALQDPNGWVVGPLAGKFAGLVYTNWATDGLYNLTLYSDWFKTFATGETATVSQEVDLTDVNEVTFDVELSTYSGARWDPAICVPVLLVDGEVVWTVDTGLTDIRGEYRGQSYIVEDRFRDQQPHSLSLGLMMKVDGTLYEQYFTDWDNFECTIFCNGGGLLSGDINRDCYVDVLDLKALADVWLAPVEPQDKRNLSHVDDQQGFATIDFFDFAVYGDQWIADYIDLQAFLDQWLEQIELGDPYNLFTEDDVPPAGVVNFYDFAGVAENWMQTSWIPDEPVEEPGN